MRKLLCFILLSFLLFSCSVANATLINRGTDTAGNRLIYDPDLDITWYDYSNATPLWDNQVAWAIGLSVDFGGDTYDDWRLPTTVDNDSSYGYNNTTSEMGHLFYTELGGSAGSPLSDTGDFQNLSASVYWSGTGYWANTSNVWTFNFTNGWQHPYLKLNTLFYGLAVRSGDVAAVPEPATIALLGIGLAGLAGAEVRRRRKRKAVDKS